jgi:hypothetical protein
MGEGEITIDDLNNHFREGRIDSLIPSFVPRQEQLLGVHTRTREIVHVSDVDRKIDKYKKDGFMVKEYPWRKLSRRALGYPFPGPEVDRRLLKEVAHYLMVYAGEQSNSLSPEELTDYICNKRAGQDSASDLDSKLSREEIARAVEEYRIENIAERSVETHHFVKDWYQEDLPDLVTNSVFLIEEQNSASGKKSKIYNPLISNNDSVYEIQEYVPFVVDLSVGSIDGGLNQWLQEATSQIQEKWGDHPDIIKDIKIQISKLVTLSKKMLAEKNVVIDLNGFNNLVIDENGRLRYLDTDQLIETATWEKNDDGSYQREPIPEKLWAINNQLRILEELAKLL